MGGDYFVALGVGVLFVVVSSVFLFVKKRRQFLWFTSLPCLALHLAYFTLALSVQGGLFSPHFRRIPALLQRYLCAG